MSEDLLLGHRPEVIEEESESLSSIKNSAGENIKIFATSPTKREMNTEKPDGDYNERIKRHSLNVAGAKEIEKSPSKQGETPS